MFEHSERELELKVLRTKYFQEVENLEKVEPSHATLRRLRDMAIEKGIQGFRGLFLDHIECK
jgi:hypothetical protein